MVSDTTLIVAFWIFAFTALVFEPLYYFGCNWSYENCEASPFPIVAAIGEVWKIYGDWDPLFLKVPTWLQVMCTIEVVIFGPLYALCAYGLQKRTTWLPHVALPFCGALFYSTVVYFAMEFMFVEPGTNLLMVFIVNIPWSIFPVLLSIRVLNMNPPGGDKHE
jgi:hypothetical protein